MKLRARLAPRLRARELRARPREQRRRDEPARALARPRRRLRGADRGDQRRRRLRVGARADVRDGPGERFARFELPRASGPRRVHARDLRGCGARPVATGGDRRLGDRRLGDRRLGDRRLGDRRLSPRRARSVASTGRRRGRGGLGGGDGSRRRRCRRVDAPGGSTTMLMSMSMTVLVVLVDGEAVQVREHDLLGGDPRRGPGADVRRARRRVAVVVAPPRRDASALRARRGPLRPPGRACRARRLQLDRLELRERAYPEIRERRSALVELVHRALPTARHRLGARGRVWMIRLGRGGGAGRFR